MYLLCILNYGILNYMYIVNTFYFWREFVHLSLFKWQDINKRKLWIIWLGILFSFGLDFKGYIGFLLSPDDKATILLDKVSNNYSPPWLEIMRLNWAKYSQKYLVLRWHRMKRKNYKFHKENVVILNWSRKYKSS
jgi:hypothetical protein